MWLTNFRKGCTKLRNDAPGRAMILHTLLYSQTIDPRRFGTLNCMDASICFYVVIIKVSKSLPLLMSGQSGGPVTFICDCFKVERAASGYKFF
jgi:hypothetical protein